MPVLMRVDDDIVGVGTGGGVALTVVLSMSPAWVLAWVLAASIAALASSMVIALARLTVPATSARRKTGVRDVE